MSVRRLVGIVLIALGIVALTSGGLYWTRREKLVDAGPVQVSRDKHEGVPLSPLLGGIALIGGIVLVAIPDRRRT